jgi:hypothetical protein
MWPVKDHSQRALDPGLLTDWDIPSAHSGKKLRVIGELDLGPIRATSKPVEIRP